MYIFFKWNIPNVKPKKGSDKIKSNQINIQHTLTNTRINYYMKKKGIRPVWSLWVSIEDESQLDQKVLLRNKPPIEPWVSILRLESQYWDSSHNMETGCSILSLKSQYWDLRLNIDPWVSILSPKSQYWALTAGPTKANAPQGLNQNQMSS